MEVGQLLGSIANDPLFLSAGGLCLLAVAILVGFLINQARRRQTVASERDAAVPLVVFAPRAGTHSDAMPARPFSGPGPDMAFAPPAHAPPLTPLPPRAANGRGRGDGATDGHGAGNGASPPHVTPHPDLVEGRTMRFYRPPEGTLQMLPGRFEIVEGEDRGQALRFVRMRSGVQYITFGRKEGSPYEHVQLRALTVSRQHARLEFDQGRWAIANLSETNPVVVNGETLGVERGARPLTDGDRIEMGEVIFRYKER
jgi:hypothetical protein